MVNLFFRPLQAAGGFVKRSYLEFAQLSARSKAKRVGIRALQGLNLVCFAHLFPEYVIKISPMYGPSMLPTLAVEGELCVEDRLSVILDPNNISRGELIVLKSPLDQNRLVCKRVAGLPGDTICVDPTGVKSPSTEHVIIPKGHIWIIGDNAPWSRDSRTYGPVPIGLVHSKLRARVWPLKDFTIFSSNLTYID